MHCEYFIKKQFVSDPYLERCQGSFVTSFFKRRQLSVWRISKKCFLNFQENITSVDLYVFIPDQEARHPFNLDYGRLTASDVQEYILLIYPKKKK